MTIENVRGIIWFLNAPPPTPDAPKVNSSQPRSAQMPSKFHTRLAAARSYAQVVAVSEKDIEANSKRVSVTMIEGVR